MKWQDSVDADYGAGPNMTEVGIEELKVTSFKSRGEDDHGNPPAGKYVQIYIRWQSVEHNIMESWWQLTPDEAAALIAALDREVVRCKQ